MVLEAVATIRRGSLYPMTQDQDQAKSSTKVLLYPIRATISCAFAAAYSSTARRGESRRVLVDSQVWEGVREQTNAQKKRDSHHPSRSLGKRCTAAPDFGRTQPTTTPPTTVNFPPGVSLLPVEGAGAKRSRLKNRNKKLSSVRK